MIFSFSKGVYGYKLFLSNVTKLKKKPKPKQNPSSSLMSMLLQLLCFTLKGNLNNWNINQCKLANDSAFDGE